MIGCQCTVVGGRLAANYHGENDMKKTKKLKLGIERIRHLTGDETLKVAGGVSRTCTGATHDGCVPHTAYCTYFGDCGYPTQTLC